MLPYVFVLDLHPMSADELNEMLSVLNSYDRELPPQLEKLRAAMLELRNKRESGALDASRQALNEVVTESHL